MIFGNRPPRLSVNGQYSAVDFTVDTGTDFISPDTADLDFPYVKNGDRVFFSGGDLPEPLASGTTYWAIQAETGANQFKVSTTKGGSVVNITDAGTGVIQFSLVWSLDIQYSNYTFNGPDFDNLEHASPLNGTREFMERGAYWRTDLEMNLWKFGGASLDQTYIRSMFEELNHVWIKHRKFHLYVHRDGDAIKDTSGNNALFRITEFTPFYAENTKFRDKLLIRMESLSWVDLGDGSQPITQIFDYSMEENL